MLNTKTKSQVDCPSKIKDTSMELLISIDTKNTISSPSIIFQLIHNTEIYGVISSLLQPILSSYQHQVIEFVKMRIKLKLCVMHQPATDTRSPQNSSNLR